MLRPLGSRSRVTYSAPMATRAAAPNSPQTTSDHVLPAPSPVPEAGSTLARAVGTTGSTCEMRVMVAAGVLTTVVGST